MTTTDGTIAVSFCSCYLHPDGGSIDIGYGEGRLTRHIKKPGHVGIDASPSLAAAMRAKNPSMDILLADAASIALKDACANLAVADMTPHDIDTMPSTIGKSAPVLVPGALRAWRSFTRSTPVDDLRHRRLMPVL